MNPHPHDTTPKPSAEAQVAHALAAVEEAQRQLEHARQRVACMRGLAFESSKLGRLHEQVTRSWYVLYERRDQLRRKGGLVLDELL